MTGVDALVICLMALGLVVWVGEPLVRRLSSQSYVSAYDERTEVLFLQKEAIYTALRDLDFDFQTGKVDAKDYADLRYQLENDALRLLRQIDVIDPLSRLEQEIEHRVTAVRSARMSSIGSATDSGCPHCRVTIDNNDTFCPFCGQSLRP